MIQTKSTDFQPRRIPCFFFRNEKWTPDTSWPKSRAESGEMLTVLYRSAPESGVGCQEGNVCDGDGVGAGTELVRPHPAVHPAQHLHSTVYSTVCTVQYSTLECVQVCPLIPVRPLVHLDPLPGHHQQGKSSILFYKFYHKDPQYFLILFILRILNTFLILYILLILNL